MHTRCWFTGVKDVGFAVGKSAAIYLRSEYEFLMDEVANPTLPGKASSERWPARTANRHWWTS